MWFINLLPHLTVEDRTAGEDGTEGVGGREHGGAEFCRARRRMANSVGAKGQAVLIGIPDMLHCVPVPVPLRSLLLYRHHMPRQNKMRLRPHSCTVKKNPQTSLFGKEAE